MRPMHSVSDTEEPGQASYLQAHDSVRNARNSKFGNQMTPVPKPSKVFNPFKNDFVKKKRAARPGTAKNKRPPK